MRVLELVQAPRQPCLPVRPGQLIHARLLVPRVDVRRHRCARRAAVPRERLRPDGQVAVGVDAGTGGGLPGLHLGDVGQDRPQLPRIPGWRGHVSRLWPATHRRLRQRRGGARRRRQVAAGVQLEGAVPGHGHDAWMDNAPLDRTGAGRRGDGQPGAPTGGPLDLRRTNAEPLHGLIPRGPHDGRDDTGRGRLRLGRVRHLERTARRPRVPAGEVRAP